MEALLPKLARSWWPRRGQPQRRQIRTTILDDRPSMTAADRTNNIDQTSLLLLLPYELRRQIYEEVSTECVGSEKRKSVTSSRTVSPVYDRLAPDTINLLQVCRSINEDLVTIVYWGRNFCLECIRPVFDASLRDPRNEPNFARAESFLRYLRPSTAAGMKQMTVTLDCSVSMGTLRWGWTYSPPHPQSLALVTHLEKIPSVIVIVPRCFAAATDETPPLAQKIRGLRTTGVHSQVYCLRNTARVIDTSARICRRIDQVRSGQQTIWRMWDVHSADFDETQDMPRDILETNLKVFQLLDEALRSRPWHNSIDDLLFPKSWIDTSGQLGL